MRTKYLQVSYYTLTGIKKLINLGDESYGEWVIYDCKTPTYYLNVFDGNSSSILIKSLLESKLESIESIIKKINHKQGIKLSLENRPFIEIIKEEETINLNLIQIPEHWIKNIQ